ncbi:MAG: DUF3422 domain-containing protein [Gammaproteobacteria bacterium]|nr:DUF3422 domain-containing protein [Gammaproteobacteria bacterium]
MENSRLRFTLDQELHARPYIPLTNNLRVFQFAFYTGEEEPQAEWSHLCQYLANLNAPELPMPTDKFFVVDVGDITLRYERHTEFTSLTLIYKDAIASNPSDGRPLLFTDTATSSIPEHLIQTFPGQLLVANWIEMVPDLHNVQAADIQTLFGHSNFAACGLPNGQGKVFMSFKLDHSHFADDGFSRVLIENPDLKPLRAGRLVQRIIEVEVYRVFALLSLPLVREQMVELGRLEQEITCISEAMTHSGLEEDGASVLSGELERLSMVSAGIEKIAARTDYRLAATRAYDMLVQRRVEELREIRLESYQTINEFLQRRLAPAIRTCEAVSRRIDSLATRANRVNNLLRTRIEMRIQTQNHDLLRSMESRARAQLRLQEMVEGLSIAAITYYVISLLGYLLKGIKPDLLPWAPSSIQAAAVPLVALLIWLSIGVVRKQLKDH